MSDEPAMKERPIPFSAPLVRAILDGRKTQTRRLVRDLRVVPRRKVTADPMPGQRVDGLIAVAPPHRYRAGIGRAGAVFAELGDEGKLGLKPGEFDFVCPYADGRTYLDDGRWHIDVAPEQRLWVRETHSVAGQLVAYDADGWCGAICDDGGGGRLRIPHGRIVDARTTSRGPWPAGGARSFGLAGYGGRWRPSIHMPRWASRLLLEVTAVRAQRLHDITEADAIAEGSIAQVGDGGGPGAGYKWTGIGYQGATAGSFHVPDADGRCRCKAAGPGPARCAFAELWDTINGDRASWESNPWVWVVEFRRVEAVR